VPLLDNDVVSFASTLPDDLKIKNGRRKHVLKEVAATLVPRDLLDRRKQGFGVPLGVWFRGNLRELFSDTLLSAASLQRGYFRPSFVRQLVDEHVAGKRDHTLRLWQLVVFEQWHQQYVFAELLVRVCHLRTGRSIRRRRARPLGTLRLFSELFWHWPCSVAAGSSLCRSPSS
jgi:asparagine synthetase B (glutamine-hydrolysing)